MSDAIDIAEYLSRGGRLTSPGNAPPRYRAELMKIMATFVDSELAGAAGFADIINDAPGIAGRIAAARIVAEKTAHAGRVLQIMGEFGADTARYARHHPWAERLPRDAAPGAERAVRDMRLPVFNYPLRGWVDAVVLNLVMGRAVMVQMRDLAKVSYQPLAEAFRDIAPVEAAHAEQAVKGLREALAGGSAEAEVRQSLAYWTPRVALSFGAAAPEREAGLGKLGLRHMSAQAMREVWRQETADILAEFALDLPG